MGYVVDPDDVAQLVELLDDVDGIKSVSDEAAEVRPPGIWVQVVGFTFDKLGGYTLNARLLLVVPDSKPRKARKELTQLLNKVLTVVKPTGPVTARTFLVPGHPAPLPGLSIPLDVHCVQE